MSDQCLLWKYSQKGDHSRYNWTQINRQMEIIEGTGMSWSKKMKTFDNDWFMTPKERMQYELEKYSDSGILTFNDDVWSEIMSIYSVLNPQRRELSTKKNARVKRLYKRKSDFFLQVYSNYKLLQLEKKRDSREEFRKLLDKKYKLTSEKKALQKEISSDKKNLNIVSANGGAGPGETCASLESPRLTCDRSLGPPLIPTNEESGKQIFRAQTEANQGMDTQSIGRVMEIKEGTDVGGKVMMKTFDNDWFMTPEERTESKPEKYSVSSFSSLFDGKSELCCRHYPKPQRKAPSTKRHAQVKRLFKRKKDLFLQVCPGYKSFKLEERERKANENSEKNNLASEKENLQNYKLLANTEANQRIDTQSVNLLPDFAYPNYETSMQQLRQVIGALFLASPRSDTPHILPSYPYKGMN